VTAARDDVRSGPPNAIDAPGTTEQAWRAWAPLGQLPRLPITDWRSALIVAAHPDDEVLGAGGIMAVLAAAGARLRLLAVTDGEASHPGAPDPASLARRRTAETLAALEALGAGPAEVIRLRLPDAALAGREGQIAAAVRELGAGFDACLAPWDHDVHADHEAVGRAVRAAAAGLAPAAVAWYPVWMWHWARPGDPRVPWDQARRVVLPPWAAARKRAAIGCFTSQLEPRPAGAGPVLPAAILAHFTRPQEVLFQ
jgi:LmbE family N-acetylglucosaminyl deacetylase